MTHSNPTVDYYEVFEAALSSLTAVCGEYRRHFGAHHVPPPDGYCWFKGVTQPQRHPDFAQWLRDAGTVMEDALLSRMSSTQPRSMLDVGCGNGALLQRVAREYPEVELTGINFQPTQAATARRLLAGTSASIIEADFLQLELPQRFDVACMIESAFHMPDKAELCRKLSGLLVPGGEAWIIDIVIAERAAETFENLGRGALFNYVPQSEWCSQFGRVGCRELEVVDLSEGAARVLTVSDIKTLEVDYFRPRLEEALSTRRDVSPSTLPDAVATMVRIAHEYRRLSRLLRGGMLQYVLMRYRTKE